MKSVAQLHSKSLCFNSLPYRKVIVCKTNKREDNGEKILHYDSLESFPPLVFSFPLSTATFICCPINNGCCGFSYAPVISKSGGHVSSPSQGSLGNYQHPSEGCCSCSLVAVVIITLSSLTSVHWTKSPVGLSLSHHAILRQSWPLTSPMTLQGSFVYSQWQEKTDQNPSIMQKPQGLNMATMDMLIYISLYSLGLIIGLISLSTRGRYKYRLNFSSTGCLQTPTRYVNRDFMITICATHHIHKPLKNVFWSNYSWSDYLFYISLLMFRLLSFMS